MRIPLAYLFALIVFIAIDMIWLGFVAKGFYRSRIGHLLAQPMNLGAAAAFYLLYPAGLMIFAVQPALRSGDWMWALQWGALFGFFCYATYDLSNLATLKDWSVSLSIVDIIWGAVLSGTVAALTAVVALRYLG